MAVASFVPLDAPLATREPDWTIRPGSPVEVDGPGPGRLIGELDLGPFRYWSSEQGSNWIVRHGGTAQTVFDREARTITLHPDPRAEAGVPELLLAGSGMAHALAADGHGSLHASAVETGGRAIAFIGPSGRGKTTLAALLCGAGARSVSDDVLRCDFREDAPECFRGGSSLRLRPQAADLAGDLEGAAATADGRTSAFAAPSALERMPLAALVVPIPSREADEVEVRRLRGLEAATELLRSPRLLGWIDPDLQTRHLDLCQRLAASVPVVEATVPWGPPFRPGIPAELIERVLSAP